MSRRGQIRYRSIEDRLLSRSVLLPDGCWFWLGLPDANGYARVSFYLGGGLANQITRKIGVHRLAYEIFTGAKIPDGYSVDHICTQRLCINPAHLQAVPLSENVKLRWSRRK